MKKSHRLDNVQASLTLAITARAAELRAAGRDVVGFGAGEPDFTTPQPIIDAAKSALDAGMTKYTPVAGMAALRESIAEWYSKTFSVPTVKDEVIVGIGGKQVIYNAIMSLVDDGDTVLIPAPYWLSYPAMVHLAGGHPEFIPTDEAHHFLMSAEQLEEAILRTNPVLLILNSPCNPTGQAYNEDELRSIADVLRRHANVNILWDNIYAQLTYDGFKHVELAAVAPDLRDRIIIACGFSKTFAMTGWRLGYAIAPTDRIKAMSAVQSHSTSNAVSFAQAGALAALKLDSSTVENMRAAFERRRRIMLDEIAKIDGVSCEAPHGAFYMLLNVSQFCSIHKDGIDIESDLDLAKYLLEHGNVATVPGTAFGAPGYLRLSFALDESLIVTGLQRIGRTLSGLR